ncbi:MAG: hypothetical protein KKD92_15155 [Proteobacteria bacterium]|nr:hypothetical protein [Pseudomonadota bacterium]
MSDRSYPNAGELILSRNRSLAIKRSDLVKRGLALVDELKRRQVNVLIGNHNYDDLTDLLRGCIERKFKDRYDLKFRSYKDDEEIWELAKNGVVNIFVLVANNIFLSEDIQERLEKVLQLITQIKTPYERPVIACLGWLEDPSLVARIKLSADFFFPLPFRFDDFLGAFEKCLDMLPGFDEVPLKRFEGRAGYKTT